jgi:SprT-like family
LRQATQEQLLFGFNGRPTAPPRGARCPQRRRAPRNALVVAEVDPRQGQLPLVRKIDEAARLRLQRRIGAHLRGELQVTVTDNRYSIISVKRGKGYFEARLHHMFVDAEVGIVRALARYIARNDAEASTEINVYIDRHQDKIRHSLPPRERKIKLTSQGQFFDLEEIFDSLNQRYFHGRIEAGITWGRRRRGPARRHGSVNMGSYSVEDRLIRIHNSLDRSFVPRFFVEAVVFHEMLHQVHEIPVVNGRHHFHTPAFRAHERRFEWAEAAERWEKENLNRLLYF